jgi:ferredoxin
MIDWVRSTAAAMGWPKNTVHSEEFLAPPVGQPFEVQLAASSRTITVGAAQSILEAMEAAGVDAPYLCRGGACGQCETNVLRCDGHIHHHDHWLSDEEKAGQTKIMPCVSRFEGKTLILDR